MGAVDTFMAMPKRDGRARHLLDCFLAFSKTRAGIATNVLAVFIAYARGRGHRPRPLALSPTRGYGKRSLGS